MNLAGHNSRRSSPAQYELRDLPVEILQRIFTCLSVNERKAVKLVCKSWFDICTLPSISNEEVLNCLGVYQLSDTYELLDRSERKILNLKFDAVNFDDDLSFWKKNGSRIRSITFKNCDEFCGVVGKIINFCENLIHLSFIFSEKSYPNLRWNTFEDYRLSYDLGLAWLVENGITRKNLNSLEFENDVLRMKNDDTLNQLFSIFPQVKILKLRLKEKLHSSHQYTPISGYLKKSTDRIEKLMICMTDYTLSSDRLHRLLETLDAMNRLTELSIRLKSSNHEEVIDTFLLSKPLKSLVYRRDRGFPSAVAFQTFVLELSKSNLEHLEMHCSVDEFIAAEEILPMFISSGLKRFKITTGNTRLEVSTEYRPSASPIPVVRAYSTCQTLIHESFLPYFQNLLYLKLTKISCAELQSFLKYQTKLKSLILIGVQPFEEDEITDMKNAFNHLTDLEHLELENEAAYVFLKSLSGESIFRNMKYLKIKDYYLMKPYRFSAEDFLKLADAVPFLEALSVFDPNKIIILDFVQLCTKLSHLRFLQQDNWDHRSPSECLQNVFSMFPSLRVVHHKRDKYFFDVINKKCMLKGHTPVLHTLAKPRIGGYAVDWIEF